MTVFLISYYHCSDFLYHSSVNVKNSGYGFSDDDENDDISISDVEEVYETDFVPEIDNKAAEMNIPDPEPSSGIQFMITQRMRRVLEDELGYLPSEVTAMEPQIAAVVIERGLVRPSKGMPASWQKQPDLGDYPLSNYKRNSKHIFVLSYNESFKNIPDTASSVNFLPSRQ